MKDFQKNQNLVLCALFNIMWLYSNFFSVAEILNGPFGPIIEEINLKLFRILWLILYFYNIFLVSMLAETVLKWLEKLGSKNLTVFSVLSFTLWKNNYGWYLLEMTFFWTHWQRMNLNVKLTPGMSNML